MKAVPGRTGRGRKAGTGERRRHEIYRVGQRNESSTRRGRSPGEETDADDWAGQWTSSLNGATLTHSDEEMSKWQKLN